MKKTIATLASVLVSISFTSVFAAATQNGDAVSQAYAIGNALKTQEHVPGISLLGGQITHSQKVISGNLPYSMSYVGSVRNSLSASNDYFDQFLTTGGWTDNYQNSVRFYPINSSSKIGAYAIRLPGSRQDIWLRNDQRSTCSGGVLRAYSSDALGKIAYDNGANLSWACSTNGYQLTENSTGGVTITYRGTSYKTTTTASTQSGTTYYRIENVKSPQGSQLNFTYDAYMNMLSVTDNRNNKLSFTRSYKIGTTQTVAEKRLITSIASTGGAGAQQIASFTYGAYKSHDANGNAGWIYYPTSVTSTPTGKTTFVYSPIKQWAIDGYLQYLGKSTFDTNTNAAILTAIKDSTGAVRREWLVTQNYSGYNSNTKTYSNARVKLQVRSPVGTEYVNDYTVDYDDNAGTVSLIAKLSASTASSVIYTLTPKPVTKVSSTGANYYDDGEVEITVSGGFPALTIDGKIPKTVNIHSWYDYLKKVVIVNGLTITQNLDATARPAIITYTSPSIATKTISYTYGNLSNGAINPYVIPTKTTSGSISITNTINALGQITRQVQTSTQTGSTSKTTDYVYYNDVTKPNYGLVYTVDGPKTGTADKISYLYDNFGNLLSESQTVKGVLRTTSYGVYNNFAQPERIVNPNGIVNQFIYNADGTVKTSTVGVGGSTGTITGQITTYTYDALKRLISEKDPDGKTTSYQYNTIGQTSRITLPNGNRINYIYYSIGTVGSEILTDSAGIPALVKYTLIDNDGRVFKRYSGNNPNELFTAYSYDANGNVVQTSTAEGIIERWTYDALDRVKTHTDGLGNVDTKNYDVNDNIILAKDALNAGSNPLTYRNGNVLTQEINTDFGAKTYSYNEADQLTQRIHATRKCNYNTIDEIGRFGAFVCVANSGTTNNEYQVNDNYSYDQTRFGRLDKVTTGIAGWDVNTEYTYDAYDRIIKKSQINLLANRWLQTPNQSLNVNYTYSTAGQQTSMTLPSGRVIGYTYNLAAGTLTGVTLNNSSLIRNISYDGANRIRSWLWGASGNADYSANYTSQGLIANITNRNNTAVNYSLTYGYDKNGRITSIARNSGMKDNFSYDAANRLITEGRILNGSSGIYASTYAYDKNGNRIKVDAAGLNLLSANSTYSNNKLSSFTKGGITQALTYTATHELNYGKYTSRYDNAGRRKFNLASDHSYYMNYNHKNERITRGYIKNNSASNVIQYVYDEQSHLIGEYRGATPVVEYVWLGDKPVAAIYGSGATSKIYYIVTDHLNTPRRLIDATNQAVVWEWDSTAFGLNQPTGSITFNLRFPGQYYDAETGQFYNHNRFYNPELGRYMEPDPIGLEGGLNPYVYAGNNPVMNSDSSGLDFTTFFGGLLTQTYNFVLGNGFDSSNLKGALSDGYNGEGSFNSSYANIAWSAGNDLLNFGTLGLGGAAKNVISSSAKTMDNIFFAITPKPEKMVTVTSWAEKGVTPDLNPGRWVMKGEANPWTYSRTGLYGNDYKSLIPLKYESRNFDIKNHITAEVPASKVVWPYADKGAPLADKVTIPIKGIIGQRRLK